MSELGPWDRASNLDHWRKGHGLVGQSQFLSCDFCGSLHPDTFMEWVEAGCEVGPTDKNYKAYIVGPVTKSQPQGAQAKFYYLHLSVEQRKRFVELYNDGTVKVGYPGHFYVPPFFMAPIGPDE